MGSKRKATDMSAKTDEIKILKPEDLVAPSGDAEATTNEKSEWPKKAKRVHHRSAKYTAVRAQIDKTKTYDPFAAVELVKKLSYTNFAGTITAHAVVKEVGMTASFALPHSTGKSVRVAIVDDDVLKNIEAGKIDFDVLIAEPKYMPKLAKFASVLGPKGLMPNPKNGTLTPNPKVQKEKLEAGTITVRTEKKAPLLHVQIGKTTMDTKALVENLEAFTKALGMSLDRVAIAATMSPGVKVTVNQ